MSLLKDIKNAAALSGFKRKMGYKVRCGIIFRDLCNSIDKTESPTEEEENLNEGLLIKCSKNIFVGVKKLCFNCNEYREPDSNAYNCGDLAKCCEEGVGRKLLGTTNVFLQDPATKFHEAAAKLHMKIGYEAHNPFAAGVYYHNSCYIKFALKKIEQTVDETVKLIENDILEEFSFALKKRIVHQKDALLLDDLMEDIKRLTH